MLGPGLESLEAGRGAQDELVRVPTPDDLEPDGKTFFGEAAGDGRRRLMGHVEREGEGLAVEDVADWPAID